MRILTGYMPATEGKAIVAGFDVFDQPIEAKRRTGYLPETPPLYPGHDRPGLPDVRREDQRRAARRAHAAHQGGHGADAHRRHGRTASAAGCRRATSSASASRRRSFTTRTCSSSTSRPPASTPSRSSRRGELIKELAGDHTIILSTHILPEVSQTCQRVVIISKGQGGRGRHAGQPDGAAARLGNDVRAGGRRRRGRDRRRSRAIPGVTRVVESDRRQRVVGYEVESEQGRDIRRELASAVVGSGWGLLELRPMRMSLEDIFLSLTTEDAARRRRGGDRQCVTSSQSHRRS